jgi:hypothetical protein
MRGARFLVTIVLWAGFCLLS